jgi:hypothetical protein
MAGGSVEDAGLAEVTIFGLEQVARAQTRTLARHF